MKNSREIKDLHPTLQRAATEFLKRCKDKGYNIGISQTLRDIEYQNWLYAQGRTRSGNIVTNAKGGQSNHNYGLAFDIFNNVKGKEYDDKVIIEVSKIAKDMGLSWGGDWKGFVDFPHFEFTNGLTISDLQKGAKMPDVKLKWEKEVKQQPVTPLPSVGFKTNTYHIVKKGDSRSSMATKYKTTVDKITKLNPQIKDWLNLKVGAKVRVK